jgi:hypothetical protein
MSKINVVLEVPFHFLFWWFYINIHQLSSITKILNLRETWREKVFAYRKFGTWYLCFITFTLLEEYSLKMYWEILYKNILEYLEYLNEILDGKKSVKAGVNFKLLIEREAWLNASLICSLLLCIHSNIQRNFPLYQSNI